MKKKLRTALFAAFAFLIMAAFYPGFEFQTTQAVALSAFGFALLHIFLRPILNVLSIPLNLVTFGLFSLLINAIVLYILTLLVQDFKIIPFNFEGGTFLTFEIPGFYFSQLYSGIAASVLLGLFSSFFFWIFA